jgi:hypothetical protein
MGPFIQGYWGKNYCLLFEMSRNALIKIPKHRSEVAVTSLELIKLG